MIFGMTTHAFGLASQAQSQNMTVSCKTNNSQFASWKSAKFHFLYSFMLNATSSEFKHAVKLVLSKHTGPTAPTPLSKKKKNNNKKKKKKKKKKDKTTKAY